MQITWFIVVGLVGVTLVVSKGKVFEGLRDWLLAFEVRANPLRLAGDAMSCSMCSGVWVGVIGALLLGASWPEAIIVGGLVSVISWPTGEVLHAVEAGLNRRQEAPESRMMAMLEARAQERQKRRAELRERPATSDISEEQAHEWLDEQDRLDEEVLSDPALVAKYRRRQQETEEAA